MPTKREYLGAHCGHILGPNGRPVLQPPASWKGLLVEYREIPAAATCGPQYSGMPVLALVRSGNGFQWHRSGRFVHEIRNRPSVFNCFSADYERDSGRWEGEAGMSTTVRVPPVAVERLLPDDAHWFDIETRYEQQDAFVERLLGSLAGEIAAGMPNGTLYADGLCLSLLGWLARHYCPREPRPLRARRFSSVDRQRLQDHIEAALHSELSIDALASMLDLSPSYFTRLFVESFGTPPHRYVMERRVMRAAHLLRADPDKPISTIAQDCGFSSQAHLTLAFKRTLKQTPACWRRERR